jgi:hypothetical protein
VPSMAGTGALTAEMDEIGVTSPLETAMGQLKFRGVWGFKNSRRVSLRTGGPGSHAKSSSFLREKTHLKLRSRPTGPLFSTKKGFENVRS